VGSRTFQIGGVLFLFASVAFAQVSYAPLFVIERNTNANVVHYEAKLKDGHIDQHQPVIAYWIMGAEDGRRQELNLLEKV
jgi:hypothetical protein